MLILLFWFPNMDQITLSLSLSHTFIHKHTWCIYSMLDFMRLLSFSHFFILFTIFDSNYVEGLFCSMILDLFYFGEKNVLSKIIIPAKWWFYIRNGCFIINQTNIFIVFITIVNSNLESNEFISLLHRFQLNHIPFRKMFNGNCFIFIWFILFVCYSSFLFIYYELQNN